MPGETLRSLIAVFAVVAFAGSAHGSDMLLHWRFDSPYRYGFVELDGSGHSNDGLLVWARTRGTGGGEYVPGEGVFGGAGIVRPRGSFFSKEPFTLAEEWTLSFWARPADTIERCDTIITLTDPARTKAAWNLANRGNLFTFTARGGGRGGWGQFNTKGKYQLGKWHHIVIAYGKETAALYLDGERSTITHRCPWQPDTEVCLQLGDYRGQPHHRFTGLYDDVRIYGRLLDDAQVREMADPESEFYKTERAPPVADPGVGYTAGLDGETATMKLDGRTLFAGQNGGEVTYRWEVVAKPDGAAAAFADAARPDTTFTADTAGAYSLRLTSTNRAGSDTAVVNAAVFARDPGPEGGAKLFKRAPWSVLGIHDLEPSRPERVEACKGPIAPVAWWSFDDEQSSVALRGPVKLVPEGKVGGAVELQPEKNRPAILEFGTHDALKEEFSLAFWLKSDRDDKRATLFRAVGDVNEDYWALHNQHNKGGLPPGCSLVSFGGISSGIQLGGTWNHVVVAYSPKADFRKLYINGYLAGTHKFQPLSKGASGKAKLVFNGSDGNYAFKGLLDEVAIYGVVLNNEEVWRVYEKGVHGLKQRIAEDPYKSGSYRKAFVEKWFPELTPKQVKGKGFAEERFDAEVLPAYAHPRLFFSLEDLPRIRARCRTRAGNRVISQLRQYSEVANRDLSAGRPDEKPLKAGAGPRSVKADMTLLEEDEPRGLLAGTGLKPPETAGTAREETPPADDFSNDKAGAVLAEAYVTLLEADTEKARRIIGWMMRCAAWQKKQIAKAKAEGRLDDWQHSGHDILLRYGTPLLYDWMYRWMTEEERAGIRAVIAACTQDRWSIGMYGLPAWSAHVSNWEPWITGEMMLALQSIYKEDGFDPVASEAASRATGLCALLMADEASGASWEGMAKNNVQLEMYALVSRPQPRGQKLISSQMPYNHVARFLFHCMAPWGGAIMKDDALGGMSKGLEDVSVAVTHYAYPDDPIINYMKHNAAGQRGNYSSVQFNTFGQNSPPMIWSYVQDWKGPEDLAAHLKQAVAEANEPLGYFSNYRGLMVGRSDWTADALQLYFQPRSVRGGHPIPARGYFRINALGRVWVPFNGGYPFHASKYHSVVTVDGIGQDNTVGKVLSYEGAAERPGAIADIMGSDLIGAYRHHGEMYRTENDTRLYPDTERPWMSMDKRFKVHWWRADRFGGNPSVAATESKPKHAFEYAFRTAGLVRGDHPYVLIADDIRKDDQAREYNWGMMIPGDIYKAKSYEIQAGRAILTDPQDKTKHLLVLPLSYRGEARFEVTDLFGKWRDKKGHVYKLNFRCRSAAPAFRMLLYPYRDGDPLPEVTREGTDFTIAIGEQRDVIGVSEKAGKISKLAIERR
jgi:hypothetical protein